MATPSPNVPPVIYNLPPNAPPFPPNPPVIPPQPTPTPNRRTFITGPELRETARDVGRELLIVANGVNRVVQGGLARGAERKARVATQRMRLGWAALHELGYDLAHLDTPVQTGNRPINNKNDVRDNIIDAVAPIDPRTGRREELGFGMRLRVGITAGKVARMNRRAAAPTDTSRKRSAGQGRDQIARSPGAAWRPIAGRHLRRGRRAISNEYNRGRITGGQRRHLTNALEAGITNSPLHIAILENTRRDNRLHEMSRQARGPHGQVVRDQNRHESALYPNGRDSMHRKYVRMGRRNSGLRTRKLINARERREAVDDSHDLNIALKRALANRRGIPQHQRRTHRARIRGLRHR